MKSHFARAPRATALITGVLVSALALGGCSAGGADDESRTLTVLSSATGEEFDPATNVNLPTTYLGLIGRRLTTWEVGANGTPTVVPDLATDTGTPNEDGTEWTYTLKDGIEFEDGTPVTAQDIKYGIERTFAPELTGGLHYHNGLLEGGAEYTGPYEGGDLASIETPDDKTIIFHLTTPYGDWPWIVSMNPFIPVPEAADDPETYGTKPVATGPYRVETYEEGVETVLVRNEKWDPDTDEVRTADPDRIVFKWNQDVSTTTQALISDAGDAKNSFASDSLGAAELALVDADPSAQERLVRSESGPLTYIAVNTERPELSDVRVRQAIEYAIDRESLIRSVGGDAAAAPATTIIAPGIPGFEEFDLYEGSAGGDIDKAKELLAEAGYADGLTLDLWVATYASAQAEAVQQSLASAGITVNINAMDEGAMYGEAMGGNPDYDLFLSWWISDFPSPAGNIQLMFESSAIDGGYNLTRYASPELDAAIAAAVAETDPTTAGALWADLDEQLMSEAVMVPLYYTKAAFLAGSNVANMIVPEYPAYQNYLVVSLED
jgi:peptide/nickel transport system substrate-binding protein